MYILFDLLAIYTYISGRNTYYVLYRYVRILHVHLYDETYTMTAGGTIPVQDTRKELGILLVRLHIQ